MPTLETNQLLRAAADACDSRKAEDIRILALDPTESSLTDYFLICNGTNTRQNVAIADEIELRLKKDFGTQPNSVEGRREGEWVLMDYVDFVVHIFMPEKRAYYGLERLRKSARSLSTEDLNSEIANALTAARAKKPATKRSTAAKKASQDDISAADAALQSVGAAEKPAKKASGAAKTRPTPAVRDATDSRAITAGTQSESKPAKKTVTRTASAPAAKKPVAKKAAATSRSKRPAHS